MGEMIPFPQRRNVGKARHVAALWLSKRTRREQDSYWSTITSFYRRAMERAGLDAHVIDQQIQGFSDAVNEQIGLIAERTRENARRGSPNDDGAA